MALIIDNFPVKKGDVWLIDFSYNPKKGEESEYDIESKVKKLRPSLILSNDIQNEYDDELIISPLSSKDLEIERIFEIKIQASSKNGLDKGSKVLLNVIRSISKKRLVKKIGVLNSEEMIKIEKGIISVFDISSNLFKMFY